MGHAVQLFIRVRPSPSTGDHEVRLFGGDEDLIAIFGDTSIGLDPDDLLVEPCPLAGGAGLREVLVGRCDCGVIGCGDVHVNVVSEGTSVTWSAPHAPWVRRTFDASRYHAEIARALHDHSWETPERTASRLVREQVDGAALARVGLKLSWASGRASPGVFTIALWLEPGPYQILVYLPQRDLPPAELAQTAVALLFAAPSTWADVEWLPQSKGLPPPLIAGPGWRRSHLSRT
jgi:hypothetical protein